MKFQSLLIVSFFLTLLFSCQEQTEGSGAVIAPESEQAAVGRQDNEDEIIITTVQFEKGNMSIGKFSEELLPGTVRANGKIDLPPEGHAAVSSLYAGYIQDMTLKTGQWVKRNQVLFSIKNPIFLKTQLNFLETKARINFLEADAQRQKTLANERISSQKQQLKAQTDYEVAQVQLEGLKKELKLMGIDPEAVDKENLVSSISVKSPVSGYIRAIHKYKGQYVEPSDEIISLINLNHIHIGLEVFEKDIGRIAKNQKLRYWFPGQNDTTSYTARIFLMGKEIEGDRRTVSVHAHPEASDATPQLLPGMYVEAEIETSLTPAICLPEEAILQTDTEVYVLLKTGDRAGEYIFEKKKVTTGKRINGMYVIENAADFEKNAQILIKGAYNLLAEE